MARAGCVNPLSPTEGFGFLGNRNRGVSASDRAATLVPAGTRQRRRDQSLVNLKTTWLCWSSCPAQHAILLQAGDAVPGAGCWKQSGGRSRRSRPRFLQGREHSSQSVRVTAVTTASCLGLMKPVGQSGRQAIFDPRLLYPRRKVHAARYSISKRASIGMYHSTGTLHEDTIHNKAAYIGAGYTYVYCLRYIYRTAIRIYKILISRRFLRT
jgi:hypothetical protein